MYRKLLVLILIVTSLFLRVYAIKTNTEFLGDQGRDGLVIKEFVDQKKFPVVGPTVGAGYYTGPFYYYLIAPSFILSGFSPVAPAIEMSLIGVAAIILLFYIVSKLFGFEIAYIVSSLYAWSPIMIMQDRRLWNPTPIPFFVFLLIASMIYIVKEKKYWGFLTGALSFAVLIQLHYTNAISLLFAAVVFVWIVYNEIKQQGWKKIVFWVPTAILLAGAVLYPFVSYEMKNGLKDILGSMGTLAYDNGQLFSKRIYVNTVVQILSVVTSYIIAIPWNIPLLAICIGILVVNIRQKKILSILLVVWLCLGIGILSFYKAAFQPQYAYQFIPIVFLLFASSIYAIKNRIVWKGIYICVFLMTIVSWFTSFPYKAKDPDIPRLISLTTKIKEQAEDQPFSFTVMNSRSFNDLHFRYFFSTEGIRPLSFDNPTYKKFFIICEGGCSEKPEFKKISVMCSGETCPLDKPSMSLNEWIYDSTTMLGNSAIYTYKR